MLEKGIIAKEAFAVEKESEATKALYGSTKAKDIGEQLILARRLAENGTRFITLHYGGWDMHSNISKAMQGKVPPLDKALSGFLQDIKERGMSEKVLLVVTGEFGRTKFNAKQHTSRRPPPEEFERTQLVHNHPPTRQKSLTLG